MEPEVVVEPEILSDPSVEPEVVVEPEILSDPSVEPDVIPEPEVLSEPSVEPEVLRELETNVVPKLVFVVPYRDREQQYRFFKTHMKFVLEDVSNYQILYVHQKDNRSFNRGAMKNIGFLYIKNKYPEHYKTITFIFNDVDTMPFTKNFIDYETTVGTIKHFYGFLFALGGIVSITGEDFERMNGYPNYWAWGFEDNMLQTRAVNLGITIDRSQFYPMMDKNIMQMKDGLERLVNRGEYDRFLGDVKYNNMNEGIQNIMNITSGFNEETGFLDVLGFTTGIEENTDLTSVHDIRSGEQPFQPQRRRGRMSMIM